MVDADASNSDAAEGIQSAAAASVARGESFTGAGHGAAADATSFQDAPDAASVEDATGNANRQDDASSAGNQRQQRRHRLGRPLTSIY
ncbi:hypothetical protein E2562_036123 [Oryza meyeriana var. granulata]|uniref:SMP domain-containing protein n=1 Tax=Oryza meyeriana var. granulata TaxID=110450 RepID=A0A6G1F205_9ORYZ|nr:hypothetical protein E2562_036123 [Oryza meyeriana var. granulata]